MKIIEVNKENFNEEVLNAKEIVLADFNAEWCGPCKMMSPIIDGVAEELGEEVKVGKVNTDENLELAQKFNIMSIPTIMIFKGGNVVKTFVGVTDKTELINAVK